MSFYTFVSVVSALASVAQAKDNDDVKYALEILNDLPADLAEPFCADFGGQQYGGATSTYTITAAPITITTTTPCSGYKETKVRESSRFRSKHLLTFAGRLCAGLPAIFANCQ